MPSHEEREDILRLARSVKDYKPVQPPSFVEAAQSLASWVLRDEEERMRAANAILAGRMTVAEAYDAIKTLKEAIEAIAAAGPDERDAKVAEALVAARAVQ